jgi:hypothetical protein
MIKSAHFEYGRWIEFDVYSEDTQQQAGEICWLRASEMGPAWDEAIDEYWRYVTAAME